MRNRSTSALPRGCPRGTVAGLLLCILGSTSAHAQTPSENINAEPSSTTEPQAPGETHPAQGPTPNEASPAAAVGAASDSVLPSPETQGEEVQGSTRDNDSTQTSEPTAAASSNPRSVDSATVGAHPTAPLDAPAKVEQVRDDSPGPNVRLQGASPSKVHDTNATGNVSAIDNVAKRILGATLDMGLPDGLMLGVAVRPLSWLRLQASGGTNAISPGVRTGVSLRLPQRVSPSLSIDVGKYFEGNANGVLRTVGGSGYRDSSTASKIGYEFVNLRGGIEFGNVSATFFVHGGVSYVRSRLHHTNDLVSGAIGTESATSISVADDTPVRAWVPSVKFGLLLYLV